MVQLIIVYSGAIFEDVGVNRISTFLDQKNISNTVTHIKQDAEMNEKLKSIKDADYYGFSVYGSNVQDVADMGRIIKQSHPNATIFWGSQYATLAYKELFVKYADAMDIIVLGDGEFPILHILNSKEKDVQSITETHPHLASKGDQDGKRPCLMDIQSLPWPKHDPDIMRKHMYTTIKTSTGCAGNCAFCGYLRRRWSGYTPIQIYNEILRIAKECHIRAFMIADNSVEDPGEFGKQRIDELLSLIKQGNEQFSFFANIRAESFQEKDEDIRLLKRMKKYGFSQLFVGIESGNNDDLVLYNKKATIKDNYRILDILKQLGIEAKWGFIMLNPYSTVARLRQNYRFLIDHQSYDPFHFMSFLMIYINSELHRRAQADGLLLNSFDKMEANYKFVDPFAEEIYHFFVKRYNQTELQFSVKQFKDNLLLYYHLCQITGLEFEKSISAIKSKMAKLNEQFFGLIYDKQNFSLAEKSYLEYTEKMITACKEITPIKNRMIREYISFLRHHQ